MQKAHAGGRVVQRHITVQRRIHCPRAQPQRNGKEAEKQKISGKGKAQQSQRCKERAESCELIGAEPDDQTGTEHAGNDRPAGDDHGYKIRSRNRQIKFRVNRGPRCSEKRVRNSQADKCRIDYD